MTVETKAARIRRLWRATGRYRSERQFLEKCNGVSLSYLSEYRQRLKTDPDADIGSEIALAMARELGVSVEDLLGVAPLHVADEAYPDRAPAVGAARLLRYPESAIARVVAESPAADPGAEYWFRRIEAEKAIVTRGTPSPAPPPRRVPRRLKSRE